MRQRGLMALILVCISVLCHGVAWSIWHVRDPSHYNEFLFAVASYVDLAGSLALGLSVASIGLAMLSSPAASGTAWSYTLPAFGSLASCAAGWLCVVIVWGAAATRVGVAYDGANPIVALLLLAAIGFGAIASLTGAALGVWCFSKQNSFEQGAGAAAFILSLLSLALVIQLVLRGGL